VSNNNSYCTSSVHRTSQIGLGFGRQVFAHTVTVRFDSNIVMMIVRWLHCRQQGFYGC
jgi:hypothetical protein